MVTKTRSMYKNNPTLEFLSSPFSMKRGMNTFLTPKINIIKLPHTPKTPMKKYCKKNAETNVSLGKINIYIDGIHNAVLQSTVQENINVNILVNDNTMNEMNIKCINRRLEF
jgi:hypothetical protein